MAYCSYLEVTPTTEDWIPDYLPTANKMVAKHGGKYLARTATHEQVEGEDRPAALRILIEWPSEVVATAFIGEPENQPHLKARHAGSNSLHVLIAAQDDLA